MKAGKGYARIAQTILEVDGKIVVDTPKSLASRRTVAFDRGTVEMFPAHLNRLRRERLAAGEAYQDHGLVFCREDGRPLVPSWVSKHFKELAREAGLPPITLHEGRHTAASIALEAGVPIKVVSDGHGHSTTRITQDLYTHVRPALHDEAAAAIATLVGNARDKERASS
ncbi:hypothetical protein Acsp04_23330 [Actinomadura sp. NBRC 104425]|nr:hypothetical protein Acsp04_23330 [Actinomadura sp. NBRC 104425]